MQNQDKNTNRILSINQIGFYILKTLFLLCLKHANIPSYGGEYRRSKTSPHPPIFFSLYVWVCFQQKSITIMVMSPVNSRLSPVQQEYFQSPYNRVYKICNRYKTSNTTLEDFGLIIDQGKFGLPEVWSNDNMNITAPNETIKEDADKPFCCTHCGSESYIKYGKKNGKQVYKCKVCNRKFFDNLFFERMKVDPKIICLTLDLYFKGVSLRKISDHLKQFYDINVYFTTIYRWIERYIEIMDRYVSQFKPKISDVWNVDEMMINIDGDWFYLWNVIDDATRFHLASVISKERRIKDARKVLQKAKKTCGNKKPKFIITDGLKSYNKAINKEFHTMQRETIHVGNTGIRGIRFRNLEFDNNLVERLQGTIRDRNKTQRGLETQDSPFVKGHQLYYNYIRPHESLNGNTPSEVANINLGLNDRKWEKLLMQSLKYHNRENKNGRN